MVVHDRVELSSRVYKTRALTVELMDNIRSGPTPQ